MDRHVGTLFLFAGAFVPEGCLECNGAELPISDYNELYSLLGPNYGGNGSTTFRLPDLRGRAPVHGSSPGTTTTSLDVATGVSSVPVPGQVPLMWCIVTSGTYPPRS